jgi:uncharacterized protein with PIN domain
VSPPIPAPATIARIHPLLKNRTCPRTIDRPRDGGNRCRWRDLVIRLLDEFSIEEIPFGDQHWREAFDAYLRFGKGRHKARLDVYAYGNVDSPIRQPRW